MISVGIVGGTGYTGVELMRLLSHHPEVEVKVITSRSEKGRLINVLYPSLRGVTDLAFSEPDITELAQCDVVFFATPHAVALKTVPTLLEKGVKVIDLSADFRLKDANLWAQWYGQPHTAAELLPKAVYGLPETNRDAIKTAQLIACPGCYPTSVQLGYLPLLEQGLIKTEGLIASCASGVSGAGRQAKISSLFTEASDSFKSYATSGHRHGPEIQQELSLAAGKGVDVTFVPHLLPMVRGIHATLFADLGQTDVDLQKVFEERYKNEPFVDVMPAGSQPETRTVKGSNLCRIAIHRPKGSNKVIVLSVIDNLVKGASGQAVQNLNIAFGFPEAMGLDVIPLVP